MINFNDAAGVSINECNPKWPQITDDPHKILITDGSRIGKRNELLNLIVSQPDIDKTYLWAKDPYEAKHQLLFNNSKKLRPIKY